MIQTKQPPVAEGTRAAGIAPTRIRTRRHWMRTVGNVLIVAGLLLMLSVGGYLGWQAYNNNQTVERVASQQKTTADVDFLPPARPQITRTSDNTTSDTGSASVPAASGSTAGSDQSSAGSVGNSAPATSGESSAPVAETDKVVVDSKPLPDLNIGQTGSAFAGIAASKPPISMSIPSVGIDSKIVPVGWDLLPAPGGRQESRWQVADYAVGHHQGSANPGQIGNVVLAGHDDWRGQVFKTLEYAKRGDQVHIYTEDREYLYIIQALIFVKEEGPDVTDEMRRANARYMDPTPDQTLTMITCWPYGVDDHRLIVVAKPYDSGLPARPDLIMK